MARPKTQHAPTRARIVEAARRHIAASGVAELELAPVAAESGLSTPTLYHYISSRRGLILAALEAEVRELLDAVVLPDDPTEDPLPRLHAFIVRQADWLTSTSSHTVAFILDAVLESRESADVEAVVSPVFGRAESILANIAQSLGMPSSARKRRTSHARTMLAGTYLMVGVEADIDVPEMLAALEDLFTSFSK